MLLDLGGNKQSQRFDKGEQFCASVHGTKEFLHALRVDSILSLLLFFGTGGRCDSSPERIDPEFFVPPFIGKTGGK